MLALEGDVYLFHTPDNGDISIVNGVVEMTGGFETAVYLALFGGNEEDDGTELNRKTWWGNINEIDQAEKQISRVQNLLLNLPLTSANLRRVEDAAAKDLEFFTEEGIAEEVIATASIPDINKLRLDISINSGENDKIKVSFLLNWQAQALR